eukprot:COSAG01_NODE_872_length_12988_cov_4.918846_8_plen_971_part_00
MTDPLTGEDGMDAELQSDYSSFEKEEAAAQEEGLLVPEEDAEDFKARTMVFLAIDAVYALLFFLTSTEMGFGGTVFRYLSAHHGLAKIFLGIFVVLAFVCYAVDVRMWQGSKASGGKLLMGLAGFNLFLGMLFSFQTRPWLLVGFFLLFQPMFFFVVKQVLYKRVHIKHFVRSLSVVTAIIGLGAVVATLIFMSSQSYWWGHDSKFEFIQRLDGSRPGLRGTCDPTTAEEREVEWDICDSHEHECTVHDDCPCDTCVPDDWIVNGSKPGQYECYCLAAYMLWSSSALAAGGLLLYAVMFNLLSRMSGKSGNKGFLAFVAFFVFFLITVWMLGTLLGTGMHAASAVEGLGLVFALQMFYIVSEVMGIDTVKEEIMSVAMIRRVLEILASPSVIDWVRAIGIMLLLPVFIFLLFLSAINQAARKIGIGRELKPQEKDLLLTEYYANIVKKMREEWEWTSVLSKCMYVGIFYFIMAVGIAKVSVVFLSWMNEALEGVDLSWVCLAYLVVGEIMFCNPLCPATPVYLTGGVVVVRAAERYLAGCEATSDNLSAIRSCDVDPVTNLLKKETCGHVPYAPTGGAIQNVSIHSCYQLDGYEQAQPVEVRDANMLCFCPDLHGGDLNGNFWLAVLFGSTVTFILKMFAIFLEQCAIGMVLGQYVSVRKLVQINSVEIRCIKLILDTPGLNLKKCSILLGGPDWPTSVLTGILRLNVLQMLIGSSPFFFLNTPTVLGGAFQNRTAESDMWATLGIVGFAMAAMTQGSAGALCFYYVFDTAEERREELEAMEDDKEVAEAEAVAAEKQAMYDEVTRWRILPVHIKALLSVGAVLQGVWLSLAIFKGGSCWESLEVSSPLSGPPLFAGVAEDGSRRDKTFADWVSWVKPWEADCTYPKSQNEVCTDYTDDKRPKGLGYVALSFFAAGCVVCWIFGKWSGMQMKKRLLQKDLGSGDYGEEPSTKQGNPATTESAESAELNTT